MNAFAPTKFPKLPKLNEAQVAKLNPSTRAAYIEEKKHEEKWGHLPPQVHLHLRGVDSLPENAVENHARELKTDPVHFAAARAFHKWGIGQEMELEDFEAAVEQVVSEGHGY